MTKTKKNPYKEQREWNELLHEKKAYILRKQEEEDGKRVLRDFDLERKLKEMYPDDPPF